MLHPRLFYKYMSADTAALVLHHSRLRWSSPLIFNDLSEFQRMPRFEPSMGASLEALPAHLRRIASGELVIDEARLAPHTRLLLSLVRAGQAAGLPQNTTPDALSREVARADETVEATLREVMPALGLETVRILCVTPAFDNEAMWANYAQNHSGCVLGFRHVADRDTPLIAAEPVSYSEDAPVVGSGLDFLLFGPWQDLLRNTVRAICYTKKAAWSYEKEWRAMTRRPGEIGKTYSDFQFWPEELESVTFGARATAETVESLTLLARSQYPDCSVYRLDIAQGRVQRRLLSPSPT